MASFGGGPSDPNNPLTWNPIQVVTDALSRTGTAIADLTGVNGPAAQGFPANPYSMSPGMQVANQPAVVVGTANGNTALTGVVGSDSFAGWQRWVMQAFYWTWQQMGITPNAGGGGLGGSDNNLLLILLLTGGLGGSSSTLLSNPLLLILLLGDGGFGGGDDNNLLLLLLLTGAI